MTPEIERRGALDVLRHRVKDSGCKLKLAFFRPASGLNPAKEKLYRGNLFSVVRLLRYSEREGDQGRSLDLGLFGAPTPDGGFEPFSLYSMRQAIEVGGKSKAMIVTRSRLHAVRCKVELDRYLKERGYELGALVAFSGTVRDAGSDYPEANMNGLPETQTARAFRRLENRFPVVASKFQTGFDELPLHTMYVDKKLGGVHAVQTLSRLNRIHPEKKETGVLDFANEAEEIHQKIDMDSYRVEETWAGKVELQRGPGSLDPQGETPPCAPGR